MREICIQSVIFGGTKMPSFQIKPRITLSRAWSVGFLKVQGSGFS